MPAIILSFLGRTAIANYAKNIAQQQIACDTTIQALNPFFQLDSVQTHGHRHNEFRSARTERLSNSRGIWWEKDRRAGHPITIWAANQAVESNHSPTDG